MNFAVQVSSKFRIFITDLMSVSRLARHHWQVVIAREDKHKIIRKMLVHQEAGNIVPGKLLDQYNTNSYIVEQYANTLKKNPRSIFNMIEEVFTLYERICEHIDAKYETDVIFHEYV